MLAKLGTESLQPDCDILFLSMTESPVLMSCSSACSKTRFFPKGAAMPRTATAKKKVTAKPAKKKTATVKEPESVKKKAKK